MSNAIVTPQSFRDYMRSPEFRSSLVESMARNIDPDRLMRVAVTCLAKDTALQDCSLQSLAQCIVDAGRVGLEPGIGVLGHCWLVPFATKTHHDCDHKKRVFNCVTSGAEAQLIVGYRGKAELFRRAVPGGHIKASVWRARDTFRPVEGTSPRLVHKWEPNGDRGPVVGYYAVAFYPDGFRLFDTMTVLEVEDVRQKYSKSKDSPAWTKSFDEMGKAKVCHRLEKWLELSIEQQAAHELDEESAGVIVQGKNVTEPEPPPAPPAHAVAAPSPAIAPPNPVSEGVRAAIANDPALREHVGTPAKPAQERKPPRSKTLEKAQASSKGVQPDANAPKEALPEPPADWQPSEPAGALPPQPEAPPPVWPYNLPEGLMPSERAQWLAANAPTPYAQCVVGQGGCVRRAGHPAECSSKIGRAGS